MGVLVRKADAFGYPNFSLPISGPLSLSVWKDSPLLIGGAGAVTVACQEGGATAWHEVKEMKGRVCEVQRLSSLPLSSALLHPAPLRAAVASAEHVLV